VSDPATPAAAPGSTVPRPATVPGQKRKRHQRWTRIATWATVAGVIVFGGFIVWVVRDSMAKSKADPLVTGTRQTLDRLAGEIKNFVDKKGRLPKALFELRAPDLPSTFDAEVWDLWKHPIEYTPVDETSAKFRLRSKGPDGAPDTPDDLWWPADAGAR
jgi:hypothetical protein